MALIWSKQLGENRYEVRSAGRTRRLYTNGVFHSQYNPQQPLTGSVWDLLLLPAFFLARERVQRVLVLGVGGGAVIRQLNHFLAPAQIVGVELDPVHLEVARDYFDVDQENVELHHADARWWLKQYRGAPFDMIIDDIFTDIDGDAQRALPVDKTWMRGLLKHLAADGVLACNFGSAAELRGSLRDVSSLLRPHFTAAFQLNTPLIENAVGAFVRGRADSRALRKGTRGVAGLDPALGRCRLNYRVRRVYGD